MTKKEIMDYMQLYYNLNFIINRNIDSNIKILKYYKRKYQAYKYFNNFLYRFIYFYIYHKKNFNN